MSSEQQSAGLIGEPKLQRHWPAVSEVDLETLMKKLALAVSTQAGSGGLIYLSGEMGVGKSVAVRAFLRAVGITDRIKSPTYALVESYQLPETLALLNAGDVFTHWDLYRLSAPGELEFLAFQDYDNDARLQLVEWPEKGAGYLPAPDLSLKLSIARENTDQGLGGEGGDVSALRLLQMDAFTTQGQAWLAGL